MTGFLSGDGVALSWGGVRGLFDFDDDERVHRLYGSVASGIGIDEILDVLLSNGFGPEESFGLAHLSGSTTTVVLCGSCEFHVGEVIWRSDDHRPWRRVELEGVVDGSFVLSREPSGSTSHPASWFFLVAGVAPASRLAWPVLPPPSDPVHDDSSTAGTTSDLPLVDPEPAPAERSPVAGDTLHLSDYPAEPEGEAVPFGEDPDRAQGAPSAAGVVAEPDPAPDGGHDDDYDYDALYGSTTHRSVQEAAVHHDDEMESPVPDPASTGEAVSPDVQTTGSDAAEPVQPDPGAAPPSPVSPPPVSPPPASPPGGLITSVPSFGQPSEEPTPASPPASTDLGDHDGLTMTAEQLRALRESDAEPGVPSPVGGPTVNAILCGQGHPNPTTAASCRVCNQPVAGVPVQLPRPPLGSIELSSGEQIVLDRSIVFGRNPKVEGRLTGEMPRTVRLDGGQAVSRSHATVRLEGWQVWVEDLGSANGTTVTLPGRSPRRLRAGEPVMLEHGAVIDFGGEVDGRYDIGAG